MPIAVVAVFALAALLSAGLVTLFPSGAQAQTAPSLRLSGTAIMAETVDVGQELTVPVRGAFDETLGTDADDMDLTTTRMYVLSSDQDLVNDPETGVNEATEGTALAIRSNGDSDGAIIAIHATTGIVTIGGGANQPDEIEQAHAELSDNTAIITVRAYLDGSNPDGGINNAQQFDSWEDSEIIHFDVTIVQDPTKIAGMSVTNPDIDGITSGTQWPGGACEVATNPEGSGLLAPEFAFNPPRVALTETANLISGGKCTTTGEEVEVAFVNLNDSATVGEQLHLVYVTGGTTHPRVKPDLAKPGLEEHLFDVPRLRAGEPGKHTITVSKSMADSKGRVYLIGYSGDEDAFNQINASTNLEPTSTTFGGDAGYVILVRFVEGPALAFDADQDNTEFDINTSDNAEDVDGSTLMVIMGDRNGPGDADKDGNDDGMWVIRSGGFPITIKATIKDSNGQPLNAGDKDSRVDFSVAYTAGSDTADSTDDYSSRVVIDEDDNTAELEVSGWNDSSKAVKVTVSATYTGPTASDGFYLGTLALTRSGDAETAVYATYSCVAEIDAKAAKGCAVDYEAKAENRFGREDMFTISGKYVDSLGTTVIGVPVSVTVTGDASDVFKVSGVAGAAFSGRNNVQVVEDAEFGEYTITVGNGRTGDADVSQDLTVIVAGPPTQYMFVDPVGYIDLGGRATFTIQTYDANDGIPSFTTEGDDKNDTVDVVVPDIAESLVRGNNLRNGILMLDADTGMGSFTIYAPSSATDGSTARIFVSAGDVEITHTVMFGDAPTAPGMPMNVMAMATSHDMITVSWEPPADDGGSDITGYVHRSVGTTAT